MKTAKLPSWTWSAGGLALALGAGVLIGRASSSPDEGSSAKNSSVPPRSALSDRSRPTRDAANAESSRSGTRAKRGRSDVELSAILESTSRLDRTQRLLAFLDRLPDGEFAGVYAELVNSPNSKLRGSERSLILQAWAERDPMSAIAYLHENEADDWERETTLGTWASMDPEGAFAWASTSEDSGRVNNWMLGTMRGIAATNPELARDFLLQMEDGETRSRSLSAMQPYVTQYGYDYAENWVSGFSDPDLKNSASRRLADDLAELDPARAGQWNAAIADTDTRRDISETVSDRWARQDLEGAKNWVSSLPEDTRTEAAEGVARHYARENPAEAAQWLATLGNSPDLDGAKQILVKESYRRDPEVSLNAVASISDPKERENSYSRYLRDWARRDADSAKAWTQNNQNVVPERIVERILR